MMRRVVVIMVIFLCLAVAWVGLDNVVVLAQEPPPPTPTLAPVLGPDPSATQTLQLQEFTRGVYYMLQHTTIYTTTSTGAAWALERRASYGDAAVVILLIVVSLVNIGSLVYTATTRRYRL